MWPGNAWTTWSSNTITIWQSWSSTTTGSCNSQIVWYQWQPGTSTTVSYTYTSNQVWAGWQQGTGGYSYQPRELTEEEKAVQARVAAEAEERRKQQEAEWAAAKARSERLLAELLDDEQRQEMASARRFHVVGSRGRRYCIHTNGGQSGNVDVLDGAGARLARLCVHPGGSLPVADAWAAQKLHIEADEDSFLRAANVVEGRRPDLVAAAVERGAGCGR